MSQSTKRAWKQKLTKGTNLFINVTLVVYMTSASFLIAAPVGQAEENTFSLDLPGETLGDFSLDLPDVEIPEEIVEVPEDLEANARVVGCPTYFGDSFELGNFSKWTSHDSAWGVSSGSGHTGSKKAKVCNTGSSADKLTKVISTVGYNSIVLKYHYRANHALEDEPGNRDHVYVEWYDGSNWHELADYKGLAVDGWVPASHPLPSGADENPNFKIRFRAKSLERCSGGGGSADKDRFLLDTVKLKACSSAVCGDEVPEGNEQCDLGGGNTDTPCTPAYGDSCNYCTTACTEVTVDGPYCGDNDVNGPEECDDGNNDDGDGCSANCTIEPATIYGHKVICDDEQYLPDWGVNNNSTSKPSEITATTAQDWVDQSGDNCQLVQDWDFQWGYWYPDTNINPGDNTGEDISGVWHTFNVGNPAELTDLGQYNKIWAREVWDSAYIPFSSHTNTPDPQESAEFYCGVDILNYDNYEWIGNDELPLEPGEEYHCVGFNVAAAYCGDDEINQPEEECDGQDGVEDNYACTEICTLEYIPFCGDEIVNQETEECDGEDGVDDNQVCSNECLLKEVIQDPLLTLTKTDDVDPVTEGDTFRYTMDWAITQGFALHLTLEDILPAELTYVDSSDGGTYDNDTHSVTWDLGYKTAGATGSVWIDVEVTTGLADGLVISNEATLSTEYDIVQAEVAEVDFTSALTRQIYVVAMAEEDTTVTALPVLNILKTVDSTFANPGDVVTYTVTINNSGKGMAANVVMTDTLPAGLYLYEDSQNTGERTKVYEIGDLAAGKDVTVKYDVYVDSKLGAGTYDNIALATSDNHEKVSDDAALDIRTPAVLGEEDEPALLAITKSVDKTFVNPGSTATYTVIVTNEGDSVAMNTTLIDVLPNGFTFSESSSYTHSWDLGDLVPGESQEVTYEVKVDASQTPGSYLNLAVASADDVEDVSDKVALEIRAGAVLGAEDDLSDTGAGVWDWLLAVFALVLIAGGISIYSFASKKA